MNYHPRRGFDVVGFIINNLLLDGVVNPQLGVP